MKSRIFSLAPLLALAAAMAQAPAHAQTPANAEAEKCPATAEQVLLNATFLGRAGKMDGQQAAGLAVSGLVNCPDRPVVQALAAELFAMLFGAATDQADQVMIIGYGLKAVSQNDLAYTSEGVEVQMPGQEEPKRIWNFGTASSTLTQVFAPQLAKLSLEGVDMEWTKAGASLASCPYKQSDQQRAAEEAEAIVKAVRELSKLGFQGVMSDPGDADSYSANIGRPLARITALKEACAEQSFALAQQEARLHATHAVKRIRFFKHIATPQQSRSYWTPLLEETRVIVAQSKAAIDALEAALPPAAKRGEFTSAYSASATEIEQWMEDDAQYAACMEERGEIQLINPCQPAR
ncbi:hypothetical protein MWU38_12570 [Qipengyuania sp. S6317L1]|uniref:hypothetical protein n=1 Tax=Qipengyuania sp. S6317L1 TaxID=2926410 RepID=UPI001FF298D4|nr:hypothetical protein [Qipengyuania sp. S6317L1]MCK0100218.1 hypothetical protein [Qipengyuania sp. S6317L1]